MQRQILADSLKKGVQTQSQQNVRDMRGSYSTIFGFYMVSLTNQAHFVMLNNCEVMTFYLNKPHYCTTERWTFME